MRSRACAAASWRQNRALFQPCLWPKSFIWRRNKSELEQAQSCVFAETHFTTFILLMCWCSSWRFGLVACRRRHRARWTGSETCQPETTDLLKQSSISFPLPSNDQPIESLGGLTGRTSERSHLTVVMCRCEGVWHHRGAWPQLEKRSGRRDSRRAEARQ